MKKSAFSLLFLLAFCISVNSQSASRALELHKRLLTVDSHTDTPMRLVDGAINFGTNNSETRSCVDLPRMDAGGLDAVFFAVFIGQGARTPEKHELAFVQANRIIDTIEEVVRRYSDRCGVATSPLQALELEKQGRHAVFLGMENGYPIGNSLGNIKHFYDRGVRYITLCHSKNNDICDSSTDTVGFNGLSRFGREVVSEMNRVGMMIDVSHISDSSFYQVVRLSKVPVVASHSCARALCDNPRNLTDDMLLKLKNNGGVVQLCILSDYVKALPRNPVRDSAFKALRVKYRNYEGLTDDEMKSARREYYENDRKFPAQKATIADAVDHIDYMVKLIGIEHVGIGTDFDGGGGLADCPDVSFLYGITEELVKRGYSDSDVALIWGGNLFRVMDQVDAYAQATQTR